MTAPTAVPVHGGADSLKKPHHITTLWFNKVANDHPKCQIWRGQSGKMEQYQVKYANI